MNVGREKIKVLIVDDHAMFRVGLQMTLENINCVSEIFHAANGQEAIDKTLREKIDLIFMDIQMKVMDGLTATLELRKMNVPVKIIALSMFDETAVMRNMFLAGCDGYMPKLDCAQPEIEKMFNSIFSGHKYFNEQVMEKIIYDSEEAVLKKMREKYELTETETEVIKLLCNGKSTKEISSLIFKSERTVEEYRKSIHSKTETKNIAELIIFAHKFHIIQLERL